METTIFKYGELPEFKKFTPESISNQFPDVLEKINNDFKNIEDNLTNYLIQKDLTWEKVINPSEIPEIEKSIMNSDTGLNAQNDSETIIINIPPLTEERRLVLVKQVKNEGEKCKITIRNIRKESNDSLKKLHEEGLSEDSIRSGESEIQEITNSFINKIDNLISSKEKEILTV